MAVKNRCSLEAQCPDASLAFRGEILDMDPKIVRSDRGTRGCTFRGNML